MAFCARCGSQYDETQGGCPVCASIAPTSVQSAPPAFAFPTDKASLMGFGGSALLLIGTFLPALRISLLGVNADVGLLGGGVVADAMAKSADSPTQMFTMLGVVLAILGVASAVLVFMKIWPGLWASGGVALLAVAYGFFTLSSKISEAVKSAGSQGALVSSAVQPGYGWAVLLVGAGLVLGAAFMKQRSPR
jgi:hypothetical protein